MVLVRLPQSVEGVTETQSLECSSWEKREKTPGDLCVETKVSLVANLPAKYLIVHLATLLLRLRTQ